MTRAYLPLLLPDLRDIAARGEITADAAWVVSEAMRTHDPDDDEEELEFEAMCAALDAADALRAGRSGRRVVAAVDLRPAPSASDIGDDGRVGLKRPVGLDDVVSWHVEEQEGVGRGAGYDDLLWYDVTELSALGAPGSAPPQAT